MAVFCTRSTLSLAPSTSVAAVSLPSSPPFFDRGYIMRARALSLIDTYTYRTDAHVRAPNFVGALPASPAQAGKVARRWRQPGVQRQNGRLCGTRRRSCLHAGKRGQVQCRPFFTTFLLPRRLSYLSRSIGCNLLARLYARFPYPLFILAPFSPRLADILASSRVCCGSAVPSSQGVMRASENRGPGR